MGFTKFFKGTTASAALAMAAIADAPATAQPFPQAADLNSIVCNVTPNGQLYNCFNEIVRVPNPSPAIACVNSGGFPVFVKPPGYNAMRQFNRCQYQY